MIDEHTKFLMASHLSGSRTFEDAVAIFQKGLDMSKTRPKAVFVDGSHVYQSAFNRVFYSRYKVDKVEFVQRVGIRARQTSNIVERLHETLKERTRPMRSLKHNETAKNILDGYVVNYNYVRERQINGMRPAQKAGIPVTNGWSELIEKATRERALLPDFQNRQTGKPVSQVPAQEVLRADGVEQGQPVASCASGVMRKDVTESTSDRFKILQLSSCIVL